MARRDVFISYSQPDHDVAHELVSRVEAHGIECWIAPRDVQGGMDRVAEIVNAIVASKAMVLIFSASANSSPQVRREVGLAVDRGVRVLPFRIADVAPSEPFEYCFLRRQYWVDAFPRPLAPQYARLCTFLNTILAAEEPTRMWAYYLPISRRQR
jgi:hypothetical protein